MEAIINESFYIRKLKDGYRLAMVKTSLTSIVIVISTRFEHTEFTHIFIQFNSFWHGEAFKQVNPTDINIIAQWFGRIITVVGTFVINYRGKSFDSGDFTYLHVFLLIVLCWLFCKSI